MKRIMLICAAGMSTSLLVQKMQAAATESGQDCKIWACSESEAKSQYDEADIFLLGPQVRFLKSKVEKAVSGKPVEVIDMQNYGMMNGPAVLNQALDLLS